MIGTKTTEVLGFISGFIDSMGYSPSTREIADGVGLSSNMTANYHVHKLAAVGLIEYQPNCPRTIRLVGDAHV